MNTSDIHLSTHPTGHIPQRDCWCEPQIIPTKSNTGIEYVIVRHEDYTDIDHSFVIARRNRDPGWVTQVLNETGKGQTNA